MKEGMEFLILSTPICLDMYDFSIQKMFNMFLELKEYIIDIGFVFKQVEPSKTTVSINKTYIKTMSTNRILGRAPHI
jgi:hypothetical protein